MAIKTQIIGSIIIFVLFVWVAVQGGKWADRMAVKSQARIDAAMSVLEK